MSDSQSVTAHQSRRSSAFADDDLTVTAEQPTTANVTGTGSPDLRDADGGQPPVVDYDEDDEDDEIVDEPDFGDHSDHHPGSDDADLVAIHDDSNEGGPGDDLDDPFLVQIESAPAPRGLPSLKGVDARTLQGIEDFAGEGDSAPNESTTSSLWSADDLVSLSGISATVAAEEPSFVEPPHEQSRPQEFLVDAAGEPLGEEFPPPAPEYRSEFEPDADDPEEDLGLPDGGDLDDQADQGYLDVDAYGDVDTYDDDYSEDTDLEAVAGEYDDDALNPDDCVTVDPYDAAADDLRSRSRKKARRSKRKADKADSKLQGDKQRKPLPTKAVLVVLAVVAGGVVAIRLIGGGSDEGQEGAEATATPPAISPSTATTTSTTPSPTCMTSPETVGVPVACDAEGDQATGTNAILAYDHAFYGTRNADKAYSLTAKGSEGGPEAMADKQKLQQAINGTPCGSTYVLTITPREIGKTYDVVVMVRSPQGDPLPSADGTCPTDIPAMDDAHPGTTRSLKQTVTVSGVPGSYVVKAIDTHR